MKRIVNLLNSYSIDANELMALQLLDESLFKYINTKSLDNLILKGYITDKNTISDKGHLILKKYNKLLKDRVNIGSNKISSANIEKYKLLFPKIKLPSGKYARSNSIILKKSFEWFFKHYDYSWDIIYNATEKYIQEYKMNDYKYMRSSQYFICKSDASKIRCSDLADYCDAIIYKIDDARNDNSLSERIV